MIITDKNRIDDLVKDLFGNISYRHELSEDYYRVVSRYSKEIKAAFFQSSWFTEEELWALREEVATLMTDDLQDMFLLVKFPPKSIMLDYEEEVLALLEKTLEIWRCINLVHMVWNNVLEQTGDALGYEVEFMSRRSILSRFGENGITKFALDSNGKALISDDTQMTLFTANGMLMGLTRGYMRGIGGRPEKYVDIAYLDWYYTQTSKKREMLIDDWHPTWLRDLPEMAHLRAPGNTCLSACESLFRGEKAQNNSKGCGGIMRVAPMALLDAGYASRNENSYSIEELAEAGGEIAEVTHKHPLGFLPASLLTVLLYKVIPMTAKQVQEEIDSIVADTVNILDRIYKGKYESDKRYLKELTEKAVRLAHSDISDADAIRQLGEGWVAEETWAIALYCAIRHIDSGEDAIIASVNHDGDSDSTGSVCGNIMGAIYGYEHIKERNIFCPEGKQLENTLELSEIILALADDLSTGCIISEYDTIDTPEKRQWYERYCEMKPSGIGAK